MRTLPLRVPVVPGESIDSWLEALARRNGITVRKLVVALGWRVPNTPGGLVASVPGEILRGIEYQAGLPPSRLDEAVLDRYLPVGPVRRSGSRYCPSCLAERDGRWLLAWRLGWVFACTTHRMLLCDACPDCGQVPRACTGPAGLNPAGACASSIARDKCCGADLREVTPHRLKPGSRMLSAQHWIDTLITLPDASSGGQETASARVLADLGIIAAWVLRRACAGHFAGFGPLVLAAWHAWREQPPATRDQPRRFPPASAALTAALAATGMTVLTGDDADATGRIRALMPPLSDPRQTRPAGLPSQRWKQLSGMACGRFLRALDPDLGPAERIRHRTGTPLASIPGDPPGLLAARAAAIPQLLWPDWAIRLTPPEGFLPGPFRSTIAACLLLPGHPARATSKAITAVHAYRSILAINAVLRTLAGNGHDDVITAISCLAGYLDACGSPIGYQRRRDVIPAETITVSQWRDLCFSAAAHPGEARRHRDAQRYLFQLLTGADLHDPRHALAFTSGNDRSHYHAFADTLTTDLRGALHDHAAALLHDLGISEPLTWQPPPDCCAHLNLPGPDPDDIDLDAVRFLIITEKLPIADAAARLGTSREHVRLALERVPRPARQWGKAAAPVVWQWQQRARSILTREFFEREYITAGKTLRQLAAETGFPRKFLTRCARQHGITVAGALDPAPIDAGWLREQYITRQRSWADIAAELGVQDVTVIAAARRHGICSRPKGVHSRPEMITRLSADIPRDVRRAVEGGLKGWHRLRRFEAAMAFPTIEAAATHLGACQSALIHQFRRLERDIGARLYYPSAPRQPMRPTRRGAALLQALSRPDTQALAFAHAPEVSGPADGSGRYRERMPISRGPSAASAQQAAKLFRALADPTRLAILLALQAGERRIADLAAELGGSQANISSHLASLKECGLIAGRPQGRVVYYRLTRPELASLLQAAEQLLAAAGQHVQLRHHPSRAACRSDTRLTQPPGAWVQHQNEGGN
jgi:DNA-binding transcriptional ArsR family regulator